MAGDESKLNSGARGLANQSGADTRYLRERLSCARLATDLATALRSRFARWFSPRSDLGNGLFAVCGVGDGAVTMTLADSKLVVLRAAAGTQIVCETGRLWITQENDPRDIALRQDDRAQLDRDGKAVALALVGGCRFRIERPAATPPRAAGRPTEWLSPSSNP